jgi:hypothetical protein
MVAMLRKRSGRLRFAPEPGSCEILIREKKNDSSKVAPGKLLDRRDGKCQINVK